MQVLLSYVTMGVMPRIDTVQTLLRYHKNVDSIHVYFCEATDSMHEMLAYSLDGDRSHVKHIRTF